uniref:sugar kinase n=1 Tax=Altererythrobacter segetis TaxID=1104773 RepID=UPI001FAFAE36
MLLRLSPPGGTPLAQASRLELNVGGAEANVAAALASLGRPTRMVTVLPDNALGRRALTALRGAGVDTAFVGTASGRMGLYYFEPPAGPRPGHVVYDRASSAFAEAEPDQFDFAAALEGAALLHLSGITPALGPRGCALASAAVAAAAQAGVPVCFDGNFRANLWAAWPCDPRERLVPLVERASVLLGNHRDISLLLGREFTGEGEGRRREAAEAAFAAFPKLETIASTSRQVAGAGHHRLAARVDRRDGGWQTEELPITGIVDRIGTGDAFAAGVLHRLLAGADAREAAESGLALAALKHGISGDMTLLPAAELDAFDPGDADVRR